MLKKDKTLIRTVAILILMLSMAATNNLLAYDSYGNGIMVTRHFTGAWDQVNEESQGILLEVIEQTDDSRRAVAYWYTYGSDRKSAWYLGIGDLVDDRIDFELFESSDVGFMEPTRVEPDSVTSIGTMSITFDSCDSGTVEFATNHEEVGSGSFDITRVSSVMNSHCSGGISDDMHPDTRFDEQYLELTAAREGIDGHGHARLEAGPGHMEFEVEVEDMPDGSYFLMAGMQDRGQFNIEDGKGKIAFRSPGEAGKMLMTFDPRGMAVEVHDSSGPVLSSFDDKFSEDQQGHYGEMGYGHNYDCAHKSGMGGGMGGGMDDCVEDGEYTEIEVDLINTNVLAEAEGEAEWTMTSSHVEFSVEIEDVPAGTYTLNVGGQEVGSFEAFEMHFGEIHGRIRFRDPETYGRLPMDFEPRGQKIEVLREGVVILEVDFPESQ